MIEINEVCRILKDKTDSLPDLPKPVDEMTETEYEIYSAYSSLLGTVLYVISKIENG